jgi:hypothetical protein
LVAAVAFSACGGDGSGGGGATVEPKLSAIEAQVFGPSCGKSLSCHNSESPQPRMVGTMSTNGQGLALDGSTKDRLVNKPSLEVPGKMLVVPGDPDASYLMEKLTSAKPTYGNRMPDMNSALDAGVIEGIRTWIKNGAKD